MIINLDILLEGGEGQYTEFKSLHDFTNPANPKPRNLREIAKDVATCLAAFANADGGTLILGVEDDAKVSGMPFDKDRIETIFKIARDSWKNTVPHRCDTIEHSGHTVIAIEVESQLDVFSLTDGRTPYRNKDQTAWLEAYQVEALKKAKSNTLFERMIVQDADFSDLDAELMGRFRESVGAQPSFSDEQILIEQDLAIRDRTKIRLTLAACLLFGKPPMLRFHERCGINFRRFEGTKALTGSRSNEIQDVSLEEPLPRLIEKTFELLKNQIKVSRKLRDLFFEERPEYPTFAWQEAIVNAVAHRNYSFRGSDIEIRMFDDRLEIKSIGLPQEPVKIEDLQQGKSVHASRNPRIMRTLKYLGYVRERGEGLPRMFEEMEDSNLPTPELRAEGEFFAVTLKNTPVFDDETMNWLRVFPLDRVNDRQRRVLANCYQSGKGYFVLREYSILNRVDKETAQKEIRELLSLGIIELVNKRKAAKYYPVLQKGSLEEKLKDYFARHKYLTNKEYRRIVGNIPPIAASTKLRRLVEEGLLRREGERRGTRYYPTQKLL